MNDKKRKVIKCHVVNDGKKKERQDKSVVEKLNELEFENIEILDEMIEKVQKELDYYQKRKEDLAKINKGNEYNVMNRIVGDLRENGYRVYKKVIGGERRGDFGVVLFVNWKKMDEVQEVSMGKFEGKI